MRWCITYRLSYRDLVEMMAERGVQVAHSTILRWVTRYVPEFVKRWSLFPKAVGTSWRVALYLSGLGGFPRDVIQALTWYRAAIDQGGTNAMLGLGGLYAEGVDGLPKDDAQAVDWYRKAAELNNPDARVTLGTLYAQGLSGLPKDGKQAVSWYRRAIDEGDDDGMASLGQGGSVCRCCVARETLCGRQPPPALCARRAGAAVELSTTTYGYALLYTNRYVL